MLDNKNLLQMIKKIAVDVYEASQPTDFCFGKVISDDPLKISVEQKIILEAPQLVLSRNVTDYKTQITGANIQSVYYSGEFPDGAVEPVDPPHVHAIGTVDVIVHNALKVGERVILIRKKGGQKFLVLDRVM